MFQWIRNSERRLIKVIIPHQSNSELSLNLNPMEPPPEEQQRQLGVERNPNAFRSMRDHIHPPRMSAPSCIVDGSKTYLFLIHFSGMFLTNLDLFLCQIMEYSPTLCFVGVI